ncbi:MAG TPA: c-type cytochrome [Caulobacteraceae bacterium]|nr:c-type cytochrome [Caulobacteraceae bacterium]
MTRTIVLGVAAATALMAAGAAQAAGALGGDPVKGEAVFKTQCAACHSVKPGQDGAAPSLHGVVGRISGSEPGFAYTPAIKGAHIAWTPSKLDQFLSGPAKLIPGTAMPITLPDPTQRHDVIAYLATLHK